VLRWLSLVSLRRSISCNYLACWYSDICSYGPIFTKLLQADSAVSNYHVKVYGRLATKHCKTFLTLLPSFFIPGIYFRGLFFSPWSNKFSGLQSIDLFAKLLLCIRLLRRPLVQVRIWHSFLSRWFLLSGLSAKWVFVLPLSLFVQPAHYRLLVGSQPKSLFCHEPYCCSPVMLLFVSFNAFSQICRILGV